MNQEYPQSEEPFSLPKPQEQAALGNLSGEHGGNGSTNENASALAVEQGLSAADPTTASQGVAMALQGLNIPPTTATTTTASASTTGLVADDGDLIEKEWVVKAKEIVERTKLDPHAQNKEMNRVKADYMKKRYNKDIKLTDDS